MKDSIPRTAGTLVHETTFEAYQEALRNVWYKFDFRSSPRGLPVREIMDYSFRVLNPTADSIITFDEERNKVIHSYTEKEKELYNSCTNKVEDFAKASKFWNHLANPDGTVNSAYGYLIWENRSAGDPNYEYEDISVTTDIKEWDKHMRTPWEWSKQCLIADKDTRQAIMRFSLPEHQWMGNKDQTCTMHGNWLIRNDMLHLSITMRSNDLMKGLVYDLPWFCSLMDRMVEELKPTYPNLEKGWYTHNVHSMHIYEKDEAAIMKMIGVDGE
jgi:thymidylate synthase